MAKQPLKHVTIPFRAKRHVTQEQMDDMKEMLTTHLVGTILPVLGIELGEVIEAHEALDHDHESDERNYCNGCVSIAQNQES